MKKRLYIFDIDDTLLIDNKLSRETIDALDMIRNKGHIISVCTGRLYEFIRDDIKKYCDYAICANGSVMYDKREKLCEYTLDNNTTDALYQLCLKNDISMAFRNSTGYHIPIEFDKGYSIEQKYNTAFIQYVFNDKDINNSYNYFFYSDSDESISIVDSFCKEYNLKLSLSFKGCYDVFSEKINKEITTNLLLDRLDVFEVIGFGNSENDLGFLKLCDKGYYLNESIDYINEKIKVVPIKENTIYKYIKEIETE